MKEIYENVQVIESPSLEVFKKCLGGVLRDVVQWGNIGGSWTVGLEDPEVFSNLSDSTIL